MRKEIARNLPCTGQHLVHVCAPPFKKETALGEGKSQFSFHPTTSLLCLSLS